MRRLFALLLLLILPASALAAPTRFSSPNYGVESIIFGGTGTLHSTSGSIPPKIISGPTVSGVQPTSVTVFWSTDKPSTSVVLFGLASGSYGNESGQIDQPIFTDHTVQLNQLVRGTKYYYKVRSSDVAGNRAESAEDAFTTSQGDTTPPVVTQGPGIAQPSATSVIVTWQTDKLSNTIVEYGTQTVTENSSGKPDELTTFHQVQINGLLSNQPYLLRISSRDGSGNQYVGPVQNLRTPNSPSITNVQITDITLNSALVQWQTSAPATSVVSYGSVSGQPNLTAINPTVTQTHIQRLSALGTGTTYFLKISGIDVSGNRLLSDEYVFKTVVLPVITSFTVSAVTADSAHLAWISSSDIDELTRYTIAANDDPALVGKQGTAGNDKLVSNHKFDLANLQDNSDYTVSVVGKDVFGNQALSTTLNFHTPLDRTLPQITNIKTDTTVDLGSKQSVQVLVSFGLSKPGTAIIQFGAGAGGDDNYGQTVDQKDPLSTNKFMVIPDLAPGQSYHFKIVATDRHGNKNQSADYLVLAPTQPVSLLDLIFGQIQQNFGWLKGKQ